MDESLFEVFKSELTDLGDANCDWWSEISDKNEEAREISGSPVFKTPLVSSRAKRERNSSCTASQKRFKSTAELADSEATNDTIILPRSDWTSPVTSKLATGVSSNQESGKMPSSLHTLLDDRSNISWSSAFATPLASNVTWSNLNSEEKKVLMPSNSIVTPTRLSLEMDQDLVDHCQMLDCTFDIAGISSQDPSVLEQSVDTKAAEDKKLLLAVLDKNEGDLQSLKDQSENKMLQVSNMFYSPLKSEISADFRESMTPDSGVADGACSSRTNRTGLNSTSTAVIRNLFKNFNHLPKTDATCQTSVNDSGAAGFSHTKLSGDKAFGKAQETNAACSELNIANTNSQDFLHDLSMNTLNEFCQTTEMIPPALCSPDDHLNRQSLLSTKKVVVRRTSTPIQQQSTKWQRRLKLQLTEHEDWAEEGDSIMEQAAQELQFPEKDRTILDAASRVQEIKKNASAFKRFVYSVNDNKLQEKNNSCKVQIEDLVKSAEILELAFLADSNKKHRNLVSAKTMANETREFLSFSKMNSSFNAAETSNPAMDQTSNTPNRSHKSIRNNTSSTSATWNDTVRNENEAVDNVHAISIDKKHLTTKPTTANNKQKRENETTSVNKLEGNTYFKTPLLKQNYLSEYKTINCMEDELNRFCASNTNLSNDIVSVCVEKKIVCNKEIPGELNSSSWNNEHCSSESLNGHNSNSGFMSDLQMIKAVEEAEIMHTLKASASNNNCLSESTSLPSNKMSAIQNTAQKCDKSAEINTSSSSGNITKDCTANDNSQMDAFPLSSTIVQQLFDDSPEDFKVYTSKNNYVNPNATSSSLHHSLAAACQLNPNIFCEELHETKELSDKIAAKIISTLTDRSESAVSDTREKIVESEKNAAKIGECDDASDLQQISEGRASPILQGSSTVIRRLRNKNSLTRDFEQIISRKENSFKKQKFSSFKQSKENVKEPLDDFEENELQLCASSETKIVASLSVTTNKDLVKQQDAVSSEKLCDVLSKGVGNELPPRKIGTFTYKSLSTKFEPCNSTDRNTVESSTLPSYNSKRLLTESSFEINERSDSQMCEVPVLHSFENSPTVSDKRVKIPEVAVQKVKKLFAEVDKEDTNGYCVLECDNTSLMKIPRFESSICNETLKITRKLFSEHNKEDHSESFELEQDKTGSHFQGFATANGKKLKVSNEALNEARKLFADEDADERCDFEPRESTSREVHFQGFATASGKKVNISSAALQRARKLFVDVHEENVKEICELQSNETSLIEVSHVQSFAAARGEIVKVCGDSMLKARKLLARVDKEETGDVSDYKPNKALAKIPQFQIALENARTFNISSEVLARKLFSEVDEEVNSGNCEFQPNETPLIKIPQIQSIATASGRKINVSSRTLQQARKLIAEVDKEMVNDRPESSESSSKEIHLPGLARGRGKKICLPNEALCKAKKYFAEESKEIANESYGFKLNESSSTTVPQFQGITAASGERAGLSREALLKGEKHFTEEEANEHCGPEANKIPSTEVCQFQGFAMASGKKVKVSSEGLLKAKKLFAEEDSDEHCGLEANKMPSTEAPQFQGFAMASGKKVKVSSESLLKAKKLFAEEDSNEHRGLELNKMPSTEIPQLKGFATASGKKVKVSSEGLLKAKKLFAEEDSDEHCGLEVNKTPSTEVPQFQGFATASGKKVKVSSEGLLKAKKLFAEEDSDEHCGLEANKMPSTEAPQFQGFAMASGKKVKVSSESLLKAKKLFAEEDSNEHRGLELNKMPSTEISQLKGFATASGKKVKVSSEGLLKAKKLFAEEDSDEHCGLEVNKTPSTEVPQFQGFATASGKKVKVSSEGLLKAKKLFAEEDTSEHCGLEVIETPSTKVCQFRGFATASGKKVNVSSKALLKAKKLFNEEDADEQCEFEGNRTPSTKVSHFQGFATASGKKVNVSSEALLKAKKVFAEEDTTENRGLEANEISSTKVPRFEGFATASGKEVNVSSEALLKVKKVFAEEDASEHHGFEVNKTPSTEVPQFRGFATASGKKVNVSSKALLKAKKLFAEEDTNEHRGLEVNEIPSTKVSHFQAFATASGKKVNVSSKALLKAKKLFNEEDADEQCEFEGNRTPSTKVSHFQGFATASGKKVNVSSETLLKAKKVFAEEDASEHHGLEVNKTPSTEVLQFRGFATASGKKVNVSSETLLKAKKAFAEEDASEHHGEVNKTPSTVVPQFRGFATASGKKVNVSSKALLKAKKLFAEEDTNEHCGLEVNEIPSTKVSHFQGFATASGKKVNVSSEALLKAKKLFTEENQHFEDAEENISGECVEAEGTAALDIEDSRIFAPKATIEEGLSNLTANMCTCVFEENTCGDCSKKICVINNESNGEGRYVNITVNIHSGALKGMQNHVNSHKSSKSSCDFINETTKSMKTKSVQTKAIDCNWSVSQEVKESAAALLADDNWWSEGFLSCPDMVNDRDVAPSAIFSDNNSSSAPVPQPGSPILGRVNTQCRKGIGSSQNHEPSPSAGVNFKVPYKNNKTSGSACSVADKSSKRTGVNLDFGTPFAKRLKTVKNVKNRNCVRKRSAEDISRDVCAGRLVAAEGQECLIKKRLKLGASGTRPCMGTLYARKREQQLLRWRDVANGRPPEEYTISELLKLGVTKDVLSVTAENALEYRFYASDFYSESLCLQNIKGVDVGDGARLVLAVDGTAGLKEVTRAFLASPGIEPSLVPTGWVSNHYRWLIWKLAATERRFPLQFAGRCLTPNMLMLQLKYRYDREIDHSCRPALRKILEHDDSAAKRLVLCVARIIHSQVKEGEPIYELELTDGWYGIMSCIDRDMCRFINKGIIFVGTKLITYGAELVNSEQPCSPLEVQPNVRLKLSSNSTRRARWDTKLGFYPQPGPLSISLTSVLPMGGSVGSVKVIVARKYPLIYIEKVDEGKSVVRSSKLEERVAAEWERKRQECAEALFSQVRAEFQQYNRQSSGPSYIKDISKLSSGDELCRLIESCSNPGAFERTLTEEQKQVITNYQMERQQQMQQELEGRMQQKLEDLSSASRTVIPVFKVRCADPKLATLQSAMLSIWRPSEEVMQLLKEGALINLFNVTATGQRGGHLQLSAGRHTRYQPLPNNAKMIPERIVVSLDRAAARDFHPPFGEVDIVGIVVHIGAAPQQNSGFQIVYLSDIDMNILGVAFWGGVKQYGWEDLLVPRTVVACCNLNKRHGAAVRWVPCVYVSEYSSFSSQPRMAHLVHAFTSLQQSLSQQDLKKFYSACEEKVASLLQGAVPSSSRNRPPSLPLATNSSLSTSNAEALQKTPESSAVQHRIHRLEQYGEPPPLSPLITFPIPPSLRKEFHVPISKASSSRTDVVDDSPPLSLESDPG